MSFRAHNKVFLQGAVASTPMIVGGIPFGILFGSLAMSYDLSPWFAVAMSAIVFAGSAQFVALGLIYADAPLWVIVSTTFIVNLRHILYAADLVKFIKHLPIKWRFILGFGLVDETYAAIRPMYGNGSINESNGHYAYLGSFLSFYLMWQMCTVIGIVAGELFPSLSEWGMEFAMVATFIGIITPYLHARDGKQLTQKTARYLMRFPYWLALAVASISSLLLTELPNNLGLLVAALLGVLVGFVTHKLLARIWLGEVA
ncbi:branched-chain amino acid ABC transporter permease [Marinomonas agarivorans]|nr:branched-chain amino acid ABC transporter permease [Marinomonas agarivorans]